MRTAIVSGSFDPITFGHLDIIERSAALFDKVVVALAVNPQKQGFLPFEERFNAIKLAVKGIKNVEVVYCHGLLAELCKNYENPVIVRGARNGADYEYESTLAAVNYDLGAKETVILPAKASLAHISSSYVREILRYGKSVSKYVPESIIPILKKYSGEIHEL